jgi:hypothetical protein
MNTRTLAIALSTLLAACSGSLPHSAPSVATAMACPGGLVRGDAALARYSHCVSVGSDLTIEGVTTLRPLTNLREVEGTLTVARTTALYTLAGLEGLREVRALHLERNRGLIDAGSLNHIERAEHVVVAHNPQLSKRFGLLRGLQSDSTRMSVVKNSGLTAEGVVAASAPAARAL